MICGALAFALIAIFLVDGLIVVGPVSFLAAGLLALLPFPVYLALVLTLDRHEPEPPWAVALALLWGGGIAIHATLVVAGVAGRAVAALAGQDVANVMGLVALAPIVEEAMKGVGLLIVLFALRRQFDGVVDGIVYGALIGLGFAVVEDWAYYAVAVHEGGVAQGLGVFVARGVLSPFGHSLFTAMIGIGCGLARERRRGVVACAAPVLGYAAAVLLHAAWNSMPVVAGALFGEGAGLAVVGAYVFGWVPAFLLFLVVIGFCLYRERRILREHLMEEVALGVLTREEYRAVTSATRRLALKLRSFRQGGLGGYVRARAFARTATRLGLSKWHTARARQGRSDTRSLTMVPLLRQQLADERGALMRGRGAATARLG